MVSADHGKECMLLAKYHICDDNQLKYTTYIWYWQAIVNCRIVIGRYHKCDYLYYVHMVSADHGEDGMTGRYHKCDYLYYVHMVSADHGEDGMTGRYHKCDHICSRHMVLANHGKYNETSWYHKSQVLSNMQCRYNVVSADVVCFVVCLVDEHNSVQQDLV
jgi:hypothetical protein